MTRISIIIPCYNGEQFLAECLQSVLHQTRPAHEVIVIDDGSSDRSATIAASFDRVKLINQSNQGVSVARNTGIDAATGDYLLFLDDDDLLEEHALEVLADLVRMDPKAIGIMGTAWFNDSPNDPFKIETNPPTTFFPGIIRGNLGCNPNRIVPRSTSKQVGGFAAGMPIYEDWHFWYRVALCELPIRTSNHVGAYIRRDPQSCLRGSDQCRVAQGHLRVQRDISSDMLARPELLARWGKELFWSSWTAYRRARQLGIASSELRDLETNIREITRKVPDLLDSIRLARVVRFFGARAAERMSRLTLSHRPESPESLASSA